MKTAQLQKVTAGPCNHSLRLGYWFLRVSLQTRGCHRLSFGSSPVGVVGNIVVSSSLAMEAWCAESDMS